MKSKSPKKKMGRPTLYRPEFCEQVQKLGSHGLSLHQIAAHLGVHYDTMLTWTHDREDFHLAVTRARALSQSWWEHQAQANLTCRDFNPKLWEFCVRARFPDTYRIKEQIEVSSPVAGVSLDVVEAIRNAAKETIKKA